MARFMASKSVRLPTLIEPSVLPRPVSNKGSSPAPDRDRLPPIRLMCPPTAKTFSDIAIVPGPPVSTTQSTRGWRLNDPWAYKYLSLAQELGIKNVHVHKGPTGYPLSADAFDVHDVDYAATDFPELSLIVGGWRRGRRARTAPAAGGERRARGVQKAPSVTLRDACLKVVQAHGEGATANEILNYLSSEFRMTVRLNHLGAALQRHRRAGQLDNRDQRWYLPS